MAKGERSFQKYRRFVNQRAKKRVRRTFLDFLFWKIGLFSFFDKKLTYPKDFEFPKKLKKLNEEEPKITWVGHCTFLIQVGNTSILTDPIWSDTCSPVKYIGPKRKTPPPFSIEELQKIDYVLISHDHYDHLDKKTILALFKKFPNITWIVPLGLKKWFKKRKISKVVELDWWNHHSEDGINFHSVPAQHYSGRSLFDGNKTLWAGYVVDFLKENKKLYFTGDTGYNEINFKMIKDKFDSIDLSLIPIGTYMPRKFMSPVHIDPKEAVQIHRDVNSKLSIGMHWNTFNLSDENFRVPPYELYVNLQKQNVDFENFIIISPGEFVNW